MPQMAGVALHLRNDLPHRREGLGLLPVVDVALEHLQHVDAVARVLDEGGVEARAPKTNRVRFDRYSGPGFTDLAR